ncbi:FAD-dependent oxidoreductase [Solirubrum puertoriconensis]|uniref:Rieske domain-containing protein n=1 Tax=Solirubrum puertoriconensis TaxID=1751427 RepID=A0A9X0HHN8_SOLP1|nr:FAD-dependent oxidoreductase [Solirubrum puertoriconensis]KUG06106.1 hypothetical protein ASU33_01695 [Solirubrum puertoriconensis]
MPNSQEFDLAAADALHDEELKAFPAADTEVLLMRRHGQYYAFAAHCPHYGAPLAKGKLVGEKLICPWHHACFRVPGGQLCEPPALDNLPSYPVRVADGRVYVTLPVATPKVPDSPEKTPTAVTGGQVPLPTAEAELDTRTFVIVGAGPAGQMAAQTLRIEGFTGRVVLLGADAQPPYDRTKLSKGYLAGKATDDTLPLRPANFYERYGIELQPNCRVTSLDLGKRQVVLDGDQAPLHYDALLLCPGSTPRSLPASVPGHDLGGLYLLRTHADAHRLLEAAADAKEVVVVGGSFIGMEAAASLAGKEGRQITVIAQEQEPFEKVLGLEIGRMFRGLHEQKGVRVRTGQQVAAIEGDAGQVVGVQLASGEQLPADLVVLGIGVRPASDFLREVLPLEKDGGLHTNEFLQVTDQVWAAGDVAYLGLHPTGELARIEHWRVAQQQGRTAALNMLGRKQPFQNVPFFWTQQYGKSLRYVGRAAKPDEIIFHGNVAEQNFVALYVADGQIKAAAAMNRDPDIICLEALMELNAMPAPDAVRDSANWDAVLRQALGAQQQ